MKDWQLMVDQARSGDRAAFDRLVRDFANMAVGYAYSVLGDFHRAEDAAQEAFIEAYFGISKLREAAAFPSWLRMLVYKYCDRYIRKKRITTVPLENVFELQSPAQSPLEKIQQRELHDSVIDAILTLPEKERTVITLVYLGERSLAEVGNFLDVPITTVKSRLYSARQRLKNRMVGLVEETLKSHAPGDDFGKRVSKVLDGIEKIHWSTSSCLCYVGSTVACMRYIGENVDSDYVMGISGGAFKLFWHPNWSPANCDLLIHGEEPVRHTFAALGYDYTYISDRDRANRLHPQDDYRDLFVKSIDQGRPVIAIGIVGPPECCIVAGYDRGGDVLYGRSYFQDNPFGGDNYEQEPEGYFRTDDWYDNLYGFILIGEKKAKPSITDIMRETLAWAIRLAREPEFDSPGFASSSGSLEEGTPGFIDACGRIASETHISGFAAYDAIIEALGRHADYPSDNPDTLSFRCIALGNDGLGLLAAKRHSASQFLASMAALDVLSADNLDAAAKIYAQESGLLHENMHLVPKWNSSHEELRKLADPSRRQLIADVVRDAKELEEQAVELLEKAYSAYDR